LQKYKNIFNQKIKNTFFAYNSFQVKKPYFDLLSMTFVYVNT